MDVIDETDMELYQAIVTVDASTADMYLKNMRSLFVEMFKMADLVIFNRCDDRTNTGSIRERRLDLSGLTEEKWIWRRFFHMI